jgi:DNA-binding GntR family transcriptional regulator
VNKGFLFMQAKWRECVLQKLAQADTGTPKHVSLYAGLVHAIESGRLKPGQKLPTETELADALPLSVGTIQRAMGSLVGDGLVLRRRGAGSFVAHPHKLLEHPLHCRFVGPQGFLPVYSELIGRKLIAARGPWSAPLQQSGKRILRIDRKLSINREFNVLSRIYVDALRFPLLMSCAPSDLASHNIKLLLAKHYRVAISHIEQSMTMAPFSAALQRVMEVQPDAVGAKMELLAVETSGMAVMYQELYVPTNPYRLVVSDKFSATEDASTSKSNISKAKSVHQFSRL